MEKSNCTQCGAPLAPQDVFCSKCGAHVGAVAEAQKAVSEEVILREIYPDAAVSLKPRRGRAGRFLRGFSLLLGGLVLRSLQTRSFLKSVGEGEVESGDIKDITDKQVKLRELTLTNQNLLMLYRKGRIRKRDNLIAIPLKYATSVEEKGRFKKVISVGFEVLSEREKPVYFDLTLNVKNREVWMRELGILINA